MTLTAIDPVASPIIQPDSLIKRTLSLKFIGIGGAGGHVAEFLASAGFADVDFLTMNTDVRALAHCQVPQKFQLGAQLTRGLGTGGDPELGWAAAEHAAAELVQLCAGADIVFLAAGLGGGTGTGACPVLARVARETGALVLAFAILPFDCEGKRRQHQAQRGLQQLRAAVDGVLCLPNQRMARLVDEKTPLVETFRLSDELLAQGMRGLWRLLTQPGLISVDFANLCAVLRGRHTESTFATVAAQGSNRAREVVEKLMASPLLEGGQLLTQAEAVLVSIAGGVDLTLGEINRIMEPLNRHCDQAQLILGATIDPILNHAVEVTLIASSRPQAQEPLLPPLTHSACSVVHPPLPPSGLEFDPQLRAETISDRPAPRCLPPPPNLSQEQAQHLLEQHSGTGSPLWKVLPRMRQAELPLEVVPKGRFEKSEPTIHHGEDLDVPTYIRRGIPLN